MNHQLHQQPLPNVLGRADQTHVMSTAHQHPPQNPPSIQLANFGFIPHLQRRVYTEWFEYGYRLARSSGTWRVRADEVERLEHDAVAAVEGMGGDPYDPTRHPHDRLRQDEFEQLRRQREDYQYGVLSAQADAATQQRQRAALQSAAAKPQPPHIVIALAVVLMALSVQLTLVGNIFAWIEDDLYRVLAASVTALVHGVFLCANYFSGRTGFGGSNRLSRWLLFGVVLQAGAFAILRYTAAENESARVFALVLLVFEIGVSVMVEAQAEAFRQAAQQYQRHHAQLLQVEAAHTAALERQRQWGQRLELVERQIDGHLRHVDERALCHAKLDALKDVARKAVHNGYLTGVADNYRYIFGSAKEVA